MSQADKWTHHRGPQQKKQIKGHSRKCGEVERTRMPRPEFVGWTLMHCRGRVGRLSTRKVIALGAGTHKRRVELPIKGAVAICMILICYCKVGLHNLRVSNQGLHVHRLHEHPKPRPFVSKDCHASILLDRALKAGAGPCSNPRGLILISMQMHSV